MTTMSLDIIALAVMAVALVAAVGAIAARSLFAMIMHLLTVGAAIAVLVLLRGQGDGALAIGLVAVAWTPILLLGAVLLSARSARGGRRVLPWLTAAAALVIVGAAWFPLGELVERSPPPRAASLSLGFWLAPLLLVTAAACVGLLGHGERGAYARHGDDQ